MTSRDPLTIYIRAEQAESRAANIIISELMCSRGAGSSSGVLSPANGRGAKGLSLEMRHFDVAFQAVKD